MPSSNSELSTDDDKDQWQNIDEKQGQCGQRKTKYRERRLKLRWNEVQTATLISEIEKREPLWNDKSPMYVDRIHRERQWQEVADKLEMDISEIKNKWNCLRNAFRMTYRTRQLHVLGDKPHYRKFHLSLQFLEPTMRNEHQRPKKLKREYHTEFDSIENDSMLSNEVKSAKSSHHMLYGNPDEIISMDENPINTKHSLNQRTESSSSAASCNENVTRSHQKVPSTPSNTTINRRSRIVQNTSASEDDWDVIGKFVAMNGRKWCKSNPIIESNFRASLYALIADLEQESVIN